MKHGILFVVALGLFAVVAPAQRPGAKEPVVMIRGHAVPRADVVSAYESVREKYALKSPTLLEPTAVGKVGELWKKAWEEKAAKIKEEENRRRRANAVRSGRSRDNRIAGRAGAGVRPRGPHPCAQAGHPHGGRHADPGGRGCEQLAGQTGQRRSGHGGIAGGARHQPWRPGAVPRHAAAGFQEEQPQDRQGGRGGRARTGQDGDPRRRVRAHQDLRRCVHHPAGLHAVAARRPRVPRDQGLCARGRATSRQARGRDTTDRAARSGFRRPPNPAGPRRAIPPIWRSGSAPPGGETCMHPDLGLFGGLGTAGRSADAD